MALVNFSCADSILVESILRESDQQMRFHAAKTLSGHRADENPAAQQSPPYRGVLFFVQKHGRLLGQ